MMTREQHLYSMKGCDLIKEADKLGVKINCNKTRTQLSEAKQKVVERILAAEAANAEEKHIEEATDIEIEAQVEIEQLEAAAEEETKAQYEEIEEEIEEETIPPFVYTINGETWEDLDIGEMIHKWSDEKKAAFTTYFNEVFMGNGGFETHSDDDLKIWSTQWDADHNVKSEEEKKEGHKPTPKRGAPIEWNGKSQNICKWGEELGISPNTLYGRIYKMGWTIEKAFTTRPR